MNYMSFFTRKRSILLIEIVLIVIVYIAAKAYSGRNLVSGMAPNIEASAVNNKEIHLDSYRGKPVLLHFWATWCPVCQLEYDSINAISQDYQVITIAMQSGDKAAISTYLEENNLRFDTLVDEHGELAELFGVRGVPNSFIISPEGKISFTEIGYTTEWGLRARLWLAGD